MKRWIWTLAGLGLLTGLWYYAETRPLEVDVATIGRGPIRSFVEEEAETQVVERFVVSAPVAGRLRRVGSEEGDAVAEGDVVAEIDPLPLQSRIEETEARIASLRRRVEGVARKKPKPEELERARVEEQRAREAMAVAERARAEAAAVYENTAADYERERRLLRAGAGSAEAMEDAKAAAAQARARLEAAKVTIRIRKLEKDTALLSTGILEARLHDYDWEKRDYQEQIRGLEATLKALRADRRRTSIEAPAAGVILDLHKESEQWVAAGTPILEVGDLGALEVRADFLSGDAARMKPGMKAEIFGRALGDRVVEAEVQRVHPSAFEKRSSLGVEQQRVEVLLTFPGPPLGDRFRVDARVVLDERAEATLVPEGALFRRDGSWCVFRAVDGRARLARVATGLRDGRFREVLDGLDPGDRVILHPPRDMEPDARVVARE